MKTSMQKSSHKGFIVPLVIAIIVVVAAGFAYVQYEKSKGQVSGTPTDGSSASSTSQLKTYTNSKYGFTFQYPQDWTVMPSADGSSVKIDSNVSVSAPANAKSINAFELTITAKPTVSFGSVGSKVGQITYDASKCALVDSQSVPPRVLPTIAQSGSFISGRSDIPLILYGGSNMSDPAYAQLAILTNKDYLFDLYVSKMLTDDPSKDATVGAQAAQLFTSLAFTNGVTVRGPGCAGNSAIKSASSLSVVSPNGGEKYKIGDEIAINLKGTAIPSDSILIVMMSGPTPIIVKNGLTAGFTGNISFTIPKTQLSEDSTRTIQSGKYKVTAIVYSSEIMKLSCIKSLYCIYPDSTVVAQDSSDDYFTITN